MKLLHFIEQQFAGNFSAAARAFGCNKETMRLWCAGNEPRRAERAKIYLWSKGRVAPNDWFDLPEIPASAGSAGQSDLLVAGEFAGRFLSSSQKEVSPGEGMASTRNGHALPAQVGLFDAANTAEARS